MAMPRAIGVARSNARIEEYSVPQMNGSAPKSPDTGTHVVPFQNDMPHLWIASVRGRGDGVERRRDEVARLVLHRAVGDLVLQRVNQLDVADRAGRLLHQSGDAFVALRADARRPAHRRPDADFLFEVGGDLREEV